MSEYYRSEIRSAQADGKGRQSLLLRGLDLVMALLSVVVGCLMLLTYFVPYTATSGWLFPILGLLAPATYVGVVMLMLYWILRWRWGWAAPMMLLAAVGLCYLGLFLKPDLRKPPERDLPRGTISILTYNTRLFYGPDGSSSRDSLMEWVRQCRADIVCLQEVSPASGEMRERIDSVMAGYASVPPDGSTSNVIYTRFRVLDWGSLAEGVKGASWADLLIGYDTVRVFNTHLRSTKITSDDDAFLSRRNFMADTAREEKMRSIVRRFRDNSIARAEQADTVARIIACTPCRHMVCGDFNDTPMSYVYRLMSRGLRDAFREAGRGYSYTYRGFSNALRIDYVLVPEGYEVLSYEVPRIDYSDHYPVLVRIVRRP